MNIPLCLLLSLPTAALALMPPHSTGISPTPGSELTQRVIKIEGYSLNYAQPKIKTKAGTAVAFTKTVKCVTEGTGTAPGAQQQRCTMVITLGDVAPSTTLILNLDGNTSEFTVSKAGFPKTPASQPSATSQPSAASQPSPASQPSKKHRGW